MKQNKNLIILLLVAVIGIVGVTIAYFSSRATFENVFETPEYGTTYIEKFTSPDNWLPGDVTEKTLEVRNSGNVDEAVRVKVEESWVSKRGTTLPLTQGDNVAADIHWINEDDWTKVTVDGEDYYYYYYNYKLAPGETTSELLDKVTFNPLINASTTCTDSIGTNGETIRSCKSNGSGYAGATYTLKFTIETVQYNKYQETWNTNVSILSENEIVVYGLNVNSKFKTYKSGNKHEMFIFEHDATAQTPALTDYRYIGNDPYNYVYFNCDDLDNQNSNTCEVWRIIGVFDVERTDPNDATKTITEQRLKLVRSIVTKEAWDSKGSYGYNDWTTADLKNHLNNEYLNRMGKYVSSGLKASAREMVDEAVFYLGAVNSPGVTIEEIYGEERGTKLCGACGTDESKLTWQGKVALMYPSDQYMLYAKGVDNDCYMNPNQCVGDNAKKGWLYSGNYINFGESSFVFFLSSYAKDSSHEFGTRSTGQLGVISYLQDYVRPVVYLASSAQIFDGDGSEQNPYKLKK